MTFEGGTRAFHKLYSLHTPPDAIICSGDFTALGVVKAAQKAGVSIPETLAVSGFANEDFTQYISPSITTINQKGREVGRVAANQFLSICDSPKTIHSLIEPELLIRESTQKLSNQ